MKKVCGCLFAVVLLCAWAPVFAQSPAAIPLQGFLTDAGGVPVDGEVDLTIALYTTEAGGSSVYSETQTTRVEDGHFTVYVGLETPLDLSLFANGDPMYLGLTVGTDAEMPRFELGSVPYAAYAEIAGDADALGGRSASEFATAEHDHSTADISDLPAGLDDGDDDTLAELSCSDGEVAGWDASSMSWACAPNTDTTYSAGAGLDLNGTQFSVNQVQVETWADGVDDDTTYSAGAGLDLNGTQFSVDQAQIETWANGVDEDTTCNDSSVDCLFAGSASEGGAAADLSCTSCVSAGELDFSPAMETQLVAHAAAPDAHHARYTDAEAIAAASSATVRIHRSQAAVGSIADGAWLPGAVTFDATAGETATLKISLAGRPDAFGHTYVDLYLDGVRVGSAGIENDSTWRRVINGTVHVPITSTGTHTFEAQFGCGSGTSSFRDTGGEWPQGGMSWTVLVGGE